MATYSNDFATALNFYQTQTQIQFESFPALPDQSLLELGRPSNADTTYTTSALSPRGLPNRIAPKSGTSSLDRWLAQGVHSSTAGDLAYRSSIAFSMSTIPESPTTRERASFVYQETHTTLLAARCEPINSQSHILPSARYVPAETTSQMLPATSYAPASPQKITMVEAESSVTMYSQPCAIELLVRRQEENRPPALSFVTPTVSEFGLPSAYTAPSDYGEPSPAPILEETFAEMMPDFTVTVGESPFDFPRPKSPKRNTKRRVPSPIDSVSGRFNFNGPRTAMDSPTLPTPIEATIQISIQGELSDTTLYDLPLMRTITVENSESSQSDFSSVTSLANVLSGLRRPPSSMANRSSALSRRKATASKPLNLKKARGVRFDVLKSPMHSDLKSPAYFGYDRNSPSPPAFSPKTPEAMSFDNANIRLDSPLLHEGPQIEIILEEDLPKGKHESPQIQIILEGDQGIEKENEFSAPEPRRGRQLDETTLLRLIGRARSSSAPSRSMAGKNEPAGRAPYDRDAGKVNQIGLSRSLSKPKAKEHFTPAASVMKTDRASILGAYFKRTTY